MTGLAQHRSKQARLYPWAEYKTATIRNNCKECSNSVTTDYQDTGTFSNIKQFCGFQFPVFSPDNFN